MSSAELRPVYLITGSDLPKIGLALRRLRGRFAEGSVVYLRAETASGAEAVGAVNALGLFGGGERLVIVEEIERWKKADVEAVLAYLESPTPGSVLALVGDPVRLGGLEPACARAGDVLRFEIPRKRRGRTEVPDYPAWVRAQFERVGLRVDAETAERLVELVGEDAHALQNEVEKLAAWAAGGPLAVGDVDALAAPDQEASAFALVDAWGTRDLRGALVACELELLRGREPFGVAARLADYVGRVRSVQALVEQDLGHREIAERLGIKEFPARKQAAQAANFSGQELDAALVRLAALDHAIKGGSRLDAELELERAIVEVTRSGLPGVGGR